MEIKFLIFLIIALCCAFPMNLLCQDAVNPASFLKIGAGARAVALGGAFVAVADDASAGYWNPAGLAQLRGPAFLLADRVPENDTDYASIAIASPVWRFGALGLNTIYYGSGDVTTYDSQGVNTGILTDKEAAVILSYAYNLNQLFLGVNAKYIYQNMKAEDSVSSSDGIGADVSLLYKVYENLFVGAIFHGKYKVTGDDTSGSSQPGIRAGVRYKANMSKGNYLNFMADFNQTRSYPLKLHLGSELVLYESFFLRAGLNDIYAETRGADIDYIDLIKHNTKPTFGLGIKWKIGPHKTSLDARQSALIFDYAVSIEKLGTRSFFTIGYAFE